MQTLFSALNVESGYNELNTCSTYSNCILAVLATAKGMGQYSDDPSTKSPYVAFSLSSLFPQTGGATSTAHRSMTSFACQPASGDAWSVFRGQDLIEGLKMGKFSRTIKLSCLPTCPEKSELWRTQLESNICKRFTWTDKPTGTQMY